MLLKIRYDEFGQRRLENNQTRHFVAWYYLSVEQRENAQTAEMHYIVKTTRKAFLAVKAYSLQKTRLRANFNNFIHEDYFHRLDRCFTGWKTYYFSVVEAHRQKRALRLYFLENLLRKCFNALRKRARVATLGKILKTFTERKMQYSYMRVMVFKRRELVIRRTYLASLST